MVAQLVGEARADQPAGDADAGVETSHHERLARVRELREMSRPALDDVAADLRFSQRGFHLRRQPPRPRSNLVGDSQTDEELETPHLLDADLLALGGVRPRSLVRHEAVGVSAPQQRAIDLRELRPLHGLAAGGDMLALTA